MITFRVTIEHASKITGVAPEMIRGFIECDKYDGIPDDTRVDGTLEGKGYISTTNIKSSPDGPQLVLNNGQEVDPLGIIGFFASGPIRDWSRLKDVMNIEPIREHSKKTKTDE